MGYKPGDAYTAEFITSNASTGAAQNADSLPTVTANRNGTDDATFSAALTVANIDTGRYKVTGTVPATYAAGDVVNVSIAATVSSVAGKAVVDSFVLDSARLADIVLRTGTAQAGAASTITLDAAASATTNFYDNCIVALTGGTGAGQSAIATAYNGSTKVLTINGTWATNPDSTTKFSILPLGSIPGASAPTVNQIVAGVFGQAVEGLTFLQWCEYVGAAAAGNITEAADHTSSNVAAIGTPATPRISAILTNTTRTNTLL